MEDINSLKDTEVGQEEVGSNGPLSKTVDWGRPKASAVKIGLVRI